MTKIKDIHLDARFRLSIMGLLMKDVKKWEVKEVKNYLNYNMSLIDKLVSGNIISSTKNWLSGFQKIGIWSNSNLEREKILTWLLMRFEEEVRYKKRKISKFKGIEIRMQGRLGKKKLARKTKYKVSWGSVNRHNSNYPCQYAERQILTKLGVIGLKVLIK